MTICRYCNKEYKHLECHYYHKHHINIETIRREFNGYCKTCGKELDFNYKHNNGVGFHTYCSRKCSEIDPEKRKKTGESYKRTLLEHPEIRKKMSESKRKFYKEHSEILEQMIEKRKKTFQEHLETKKKMSESRKRFIEEHPEIRRKENSLKRVILILLNFSLKKERV